MIGKTLVVVAALICVASADCFGYVPTIFSGCETSRVCGTRVLNVGCSVPVVSATPACAPIAVPSHVVDPVSVVPAPVARVVSLGSAAVDGCGRLLTTVC